MWQCGPFPSSQGDDKCVLVCRVNVGQSLEKRDPLSWGGGDRVEVSDADLLRSGYDSIENFGEWMLPTDDYGQICMTTLEVMVFQYGCWNNNRDGKVVELSRTFSADEFVDVFQRRRRNGTGWFSSSDSPVVFDRCPKGHRCEIFLGARQCDECKIVQQGTWHQCATCDYDKCRNCVVGKTSICRCGKALSLCAQGENIGHQCDVCGSKIAAGEGQNLRCNSCDFDVCVNCRFSSESRTRIYCPKGHCCQRFFGAGGSSGHCDKCWRNLNESESYRGGRYRCNVCDYDECCLCVEKDYRTVCPCGGALLYGKRSAGVICDVCSDAAGAEFHHCARGCDYDLCGLCYVDQSRGSRAVVQCPIGHVCEVRLSRDEKTSIPRGYVFPECDECRVKLDANGCERFFHCPRCKYDRCDVCVLVGTVRWGEELPLDSS